MLSCYFQSVYSTNFIDALSLEYEDEQPLCSLGVQMQAGKQIRNITDNANIHDLGCHDGSDETQRNLISLTAECFSTLIQFLNDNLG
jgi:hypothetical protein